MKTKNQFIVILSVLIITLAIAVPSYLFVPEAKESVKVSDFPMAIGAWQGKDLPVDERAYEILETRNLILREYAKGNEKVYFYIIYSQDNRKVSHPPEVCFEGSGITIVKKDKVALELADGSRILANELVVEKKGPTNLVLYWYKAGNFYTDNYLKQQLSIALSRLRFKPTSSAMIRLSVEMASNDTKNALADIQSFVKEASAYFSQVIP